MSAATCRESDPDVASLIRATGLQAPVFRFNCQTATPSLRANGSARTRGPMTGSAKRIHDVSAAGSVDCFVACAPRMATGRALAFSRHDLPEFCKTSPSKPGGRREHRMHQSHPRLRISKKRHRYADTPALPAQWFTAYTCSPRRTGLVSRRRLSRTSCEKLDPSVGGSGPHDFARPCRARSSGDANTSIASRFQRP
jgi:hypothetical protein